MKKRPNCNDLNIVSTAEQQDLPVSHRQTTDSLSLY